MVSAMSTKRALVTVLGALAIASIAVAMMWQAPSEPAVVASGEAGAVTAPDSRSIFPKVLNR